MQWHRGRRHALRNTPPSDSKDARAIVLPRAAAPASAGASVKATVCARMARIVFVIAPAFPLRSAAAVVSRPAARGVLAVPAPFDKYPDSVLLSKIGNMVNRDQFRL